MEGEAEAEASAGLEASGSTGEGFAGAKGSITGGAEASFGLSDDGISFSAKAKDGVEKVWDGITGVL